MKQWIENQAKALADYASLKYRGLHSEAHDHVRLYTEDCLREAQAKTIEACLAAVRAIWSKHGKHAHWYNKALLDAEQAIKGVGDES